MSCLAMVESGSYAIKLVKELEGVGILCKVVSTPFKLAQKGCGYSVRFSFSDKDKLLSVASNSNIKVKSIYQIDKEAKRSKYQKLL